MYHIESELIVCFCCVDQGPYCVVLCCVVQVFLPLLVEYFSEHELRQLRQRVIDLHKLDLSSIGR